MKKSSNKKQSPAQGMTVSTALTYIDFSQFPPQPIATHAQLDSSLVECIGQTILDGIAKAFQQNDTPTFVKCYQALHFCLGLDMESHRMNFLGGNGKLAVLMTAFQAAVSFDRVDLATALFDTCIASPEHPIRAKICGPVQMIIYAYSMQAIPGSKNQATWLTAVDQMIKGFVDRLTLIDQNQLCPTTGMVFQAGNSLKAGDKFDAIDRMCTAMKTRHTLLIAQGINSPHGSASNDGRL